MAGVKKTDLKLMPLDDLGKVVGALAKLPKEKAKPKRRKVKRSTKRKRKPRVA